MRVKGNHVLNNHTGKGAKPWQPAFAIGGWLRKGGWGCSCIQLWGETDGQSLYVF